MKPNSETNESGICDEFIFKFGALTTSAEYELKVPINIPYTGSVIEFTHRLINTLKLPCYIEPDLCSALEKFITDRSVQYKDSQADVLLLKAQAGDINLEDVVKQWEAAFKGEVVQYCGPIALSDEELFAEAYHRLVHSPMLERVLAGEQALSAQVSALVAKRDAEIQELNDTMATEMNNALECLPEQEVSALAQQHWEQRELLHGEWESRLEALRATQRREARSWLMSLSQQQQTADSDLPQSPVTPWPSVEIPVNTDEFQPPELQESFTIHLGSQMKQMHNIRLMACDVLSLCQCRGQPQRLHTSLSLYSNELHGLVLFTDCQPPLSSRMSAGFRAVCQQGTELHFISVEQQLENVTAQNVKAAEWRALNSEVKHGSPSKSSLQPGDCYITKHSSLAEVHVVFHLLSDDSLISGDVTSRHPVILGLRNILKTASAYDVTCLSIPLLLVHEMSEEMTVAWCSKRAELVYKCIKGFMIETASWGGSELKTLQFILPKGISEDLFASLAVMLPSIFRVANPLKFKAK